MKTEAIKAKLTILRLLLAPWLNRLHYIGEDEAADLFSEVIDSYESAVLGSAMWRDRAVKQGWREE